MRAKVASQPSASSSSIKCTTGLSNCSSNAWPLPKWDPLKQDTEIGPLARHDLRDTLHRQVESSIAKGARCVLGGEIPRGPGAYYPPTVLTKVTKGMPAYAEELFGPVASVIRVDNEDAAIAAGNDSVFGLGGGVITGDIARGERVAAQIESGNVFVNDNVRSDPRLPFGGIKESGHRRELSYYGIKEFVNIRRSWWPEREAS
jgi:succinate-semialdehyde dehydrogenase/glutarate-semialdehyde dehydrogenase